MFLKLQKKGVGLRKGGGDSLFQLSVAEGQRKFALKLMMPIQF